MSDSILIAYYSWSGNTQKLAQRIHEITGGTILEIIPQVSYPGDYTMTVNQAKKEIMEKFRPAIESSIDSIDKYNKIFIGSPNWWSTFAPPVATFLDQYDFTSKTIVPFCTHGGGGKGRIKNDISRQCPDSIITECIEMYGSRIDHNILMKWLKNAGLLSD